MAHGEYGEPSARVDDQTRHFLERRRVAHLATADASGAPHVVPICFTLLEDTLYIAIDEKPKSADVRRLRRLRNIAENPRIAIVADVYDDADWTQLGFVMLRADARVIGPEAAEHAPAVAALRAKYPQYRAMALDDRPVIAADVTTVTGWGRLNSQHT
ncbi:MAG: TIGR03668 family PPOX class F420-dependent oxidoreductase [Chloroflexi bacterium]|nr:TIGR03668 family PPOX class F420-dependent oxidoreductase [Chloroflexota bacterium]